MSTIHHICTLSDLVIDKQEIYRCMGYQDHPDKEIIKITDEVLDEVVLVCKPQYMYKIYGGEVEDKFRIKIDNKQFKPGRIINSYLDGTEQFCVFVTTAGAELDNMKNEARGQGDLVKEFVLDSIGSVVAEACVTKISDELYQLSSMEHSYSYSPGYCGWKLSEQKSLFDLLPDKPCGIELTESCLMLPIKSVSGIIALGSKIERKAYSCAICNNINCYKRK